MAAIQVRLNACCGAESRCLSEGWGFRKKKPREQAVEVGGERVLRDQDWRAKHGVQYGG